MGIPVSNLRVHTPQRLRLRSGTSRPHEAAPQAPETRRLERRQAHGQERQVVRAGGRLDRSVMEPTQGRSGRTPMDGVRPMQTRAHLPSEGQNWLMVCQQGREASSLT